MARHAHEDALSDAEFEQLVDGAKLLEPPWNLEALFVVLVAGRLGLRIGETAHAHRSWLSLEKGMLEIPSQDASRAAGRRRRSTSSTPDHSHTA